MLYGKPRDAFLEFLRNLTPQGLFLAGFFFLAQQFDKPLPENKTVLLVACLGCFFVFVIASMANLIKFFEAIVELQSVNFKNALQRIKQSNLSIWTKGCKRIVALWQHNKSGLFLGVCALGIVCLSFIPVTIIALQGIQRKV